MMLMLAIEATAFITMASILVSVLPRRHPIRLAMQQRKGLVLVGVAAVEFGVRPKAHLVFRRLCGGNAIGMFGTVAHGNISKGTGFLICIRGVLRDRSQSNLIMGGCKNGMLWVLHFTAFVRAFFLNKGICAFNDFSRIPFSIGVCSYVPNLRFCNFCSISASRLKVEGRSTSQVSNMFLEDISACIVTNRSSLESVIICFSTLKEA